eukprot:3167720-Prymnesium_polylepis.2
MFHVLQTLHVHVGCGMCVCMCSVKARPDGTPPSSSTRRAHIRTLHTKTFIRFAMKGRLSFDVSPIRITIFTDESLEAHQSPDTAGSLRE